MSGLDDRLADLARAAFPQIEAIRAEPHRVPPAPFPESSALWLAIAQAVLARPEFAAASHAIGSDPALGPATGHFYRSGIGTGRTLDAAVMPMAFIEAALLRLLARGLPLSADALADGTVLAAEDLRRGVAEKPITGWIMAGFSGSELLAGRSLTTPWSAQLVPGRPAHNVRSGADACFRRRR